MTLYEAARRWITDTGLPITDRLDAHQVWSVVDQRYPGGWPAFTTSHQKATS